MEGRASANGNLIQLFMEEIDEQLDAVIKISKGEKTSGEGIKCYVWNGSIYNA